MSDGVRDNKKFDEEMRRYELGRTFGTPEYTHRKNYPGDAARAHTCDDTGCLNYRKPNPLQTWFLCPACAAMAPDTIESLTHVPYKSLPTKKKRQQANAAAYAAWISLYKRGIIGQHEPKQGV
jgi:hypothetical protein